LTACFNYLPIISFTTPNQVTPPNGMMVTP